MTIPALRTVPMPSRNPAIAGDRLKLRLMSCAIALLGAAAACSGTIETQETEPSARSGATNNQGTGTNARNPLSPTEPPGFAPVTGGGNEGEQPDVDRISDGSSTRGSSGSTRRRGSVRDDDDERDAGIDEEIDGGVIDGGVEVEADAGGIEVDAGVVDAGAAL